MQGVLILLCRTASYRTRRAITLASTAAIAAMPTVPNSHLRFLSCPVI